MSTEYVCRTATAIDPQLKEIIKRDAMNKGVTESVLLRHILTTHYAFSLSEARNQRNQVSEEDNNGY